MYGFKENDNLGLCASEVVGGRFCLHLPILVIFDKNISLLPNPEYYFSPHLFFLCKAKGQIFQHMELLLLFVLDLARCCFLWHETGFMEAGRECKTWILTWVHIHTFFLHDIWYPGSRPLFLTPVLQIRRDLSLACPRYLDFHTTGMRALWWLMLALQIDGWTLLTALECSAFSQQTTMI